LHLTALSSSEMFFIAFSLVVVAKNGILNHLESIVDKYKWLTKIDKGITKVIVTTVVVSSTVQWLNIFIRSENK